MDLEHTHTHMRARAITFKRITEENGTGFVFRGLLRRMEQCAINIKLYLYIHTAHTKKKERNAKSLVDESHIAGVTRLPSTFVKNLKRVSFATQSLQAKNAQFQRSFVIVVVFFLVYVPFSSLHIENQLSFVLTYNSHLHAQRCVCAVATY